MTRVKSVVARRRRAKSILKKTKGYRGVNSRLFIYAKEQLKQALNSAYKGRKLKKQINKKNWIKTLKIHFNSHNKKYGEMLKIFRENRVLLNRKMLDKIFFFNKNFVKIFINLF